MNARRSSQRQYAAIAAALFTLAATYVVLAPASAAAFEGTVELPLPSTHQAHEPHLAINPKNPDNMIVVSHDDFGSHRNGLRSWYTLDGGASWSDGIVTGLKYKKYKAYMADPVIAFGPDGRAYFASLVLPVLSPRRWLSLVVVRISDDGGKSFPISRVLARSRHKGKFSKNNFISELTSGQTAFYDKEWLAVDATQGPSSGTIYTTWDRRISAEPTLMFSRSTDSSTIFIKLQGIDKGALSQITIRPDGTVDLLWMRFTPHPVFGMDSPSMSIIHASSSDGGLTISPMHKLPGSKGGSDLPPTMTANSKGSLLACWSRPIPDVYTTKNPRTKIVCSNSQDGTNWSSPLTLDGNAPKSTLQTLPAATSQGERFWVVAQVQSLKWTEIVLYRSDDGGKSFSRYKTLGSRKYGKSEGPFTGHYMGLAASADHVVAAYALGDGNRSERLAKLYFTSVKAPLQ